MPSTYYHLPHLTASSNNSDSSNGPFQIVVTTTITTKLGCRSEAPNYRRPYIDHHHHQSQSFVVLFTSIHRRL